jgi:hypothetical protein
MSILNKFLKYKMFHLSTFRDKITKRRDAKRLAAKEKDLCAGISTTAAKRQDHALKHRVRCGLAGVF